MATTYQLISSNVLTSSAASVTFSSIPSTYTDLVIKLSARCTYTGNAYPNYLYTRFNSDTGSNYSETLLFGQDSTAYSSRNSNTTFSQMLTENSDASTASTFSNVEFYIPNYLATTTKPFSNFGVAENNATTAYIGGVGASQYRGTSAISSITFSMSAGAGSFLTGSSFYLYGIRSA